MLTISGKTLGKKKPLFADFSVPLPPDLDEDGGLTLRDLIARIVRIEVQAFQERQQERQFFRALTATDIEKGVARGKVEMGGSEVGLQEVDEEESVAIALEAFEDGLYLVVVDGEDKRNLDEQVYLQAETRITFVRLAMLAGG